MKGTLQMKNITKLSFLIILPLALAGCNKQIFDFDYTYTEAICNIGGEYQTIKLKSWTDYEDGEQLQLKDYEGNTYLVSSINCTLKG